MTFMECVTSQLAYIEKDIKPALGVDNAYIPNLVPILLIAVRERIARLGKPQRVSAMFWQIFRVYILWGVVHSSFLNVDAERREHVENTSRASAQEGTL